MQTEEKRDLLISTAIGGLIGVLIVAFSREIPQMGLNDQYVIIQIIAFSLFAGSMPIRAYFATSPQGILVSTAISVTGVIVLIGVLADTVGILPNLILLIAYGIGAALTYTGFSGSFFSEQYLHLITIVVAAWILSFCIIILLGLVFGGAATLLSGVVLVAVVITFVVLCDSIAAEMNTVPTFP